MHQVLPGFTRLSLASKTPHMPMFATSGPKELLEPVLAGALRMGPPGPARHRIGCWSTLGLAGTLEIERSSFLRFAGAIRVRSSSQFRLRWGAQNHFTCRRLRLRARSASPGRSNRPLEPTRLRWDTRNRPLQPAWLRSAALNWPLETLRPRRGAPMGRSIPLRPCWGARIGRSNLLWRCWGAGIGRSTSRDRFGLNLGGH